MLNQYYNPFVDFYATKFPLFLSNSIVGSMPEEKPLEHSLLRASLDYLNKSQQKNQAYSEVSDAVVYYYSGVERKDSFMKKLDQAISKTDMREILQ